ncbi:MAG: class I SAM-dependent methyltransferase [Deltaproteobacteria bacterium]|nr:class I SAM-dependent methyltransferase [Deltaproteobacteria bacterium]
MESVISAKDIVLDEASYVDPNGRVFEWQGEIFRGISKGKSNLYRTLIEDGFIHTLIQKKMLVASEMTSYTLQPFDLVLKHERVGRRSYCMEWAPEMIKDAALLTLDLNLALLEKDLILQDAYPWNIFFKGPHPIFIDFGSIEHIDATVIWKAYDQFCGFFLYPLILMETYPIAQLRFFYFDYLTGLSLNDFIRLLPLSYQLKHPLFSCELHGVRLLERMAERFPAKSKAYLEKSKEMAKTRSTKALRIKFMKNLKKRVERIRVGHTSSFWQRYNENLHVQYEDVEIHQKEHSVRTVLDKLPIKSLLDVGCNTGKYAIEAAQRKLEVIALDRDEQCITALYRLAKSQNLNILPLVMDLCNPTPAFGWECRQFDSALERFQCDVVLALAVIHHWIFKQRQDFKRIFRMFHRLSKSHLVVEFVDRADTVIQPCLEERFYWYTLDSFKKEFSHYFELEMTLPSDRPTRTIFVGRRKQPI